MTGPADVAELADVSPGEAAMVDRVVPPDSAPTTDVSPPPACVLRRTDGPVAVHRHGDAGPYHSPSLVWNAAQGTFEAFATFVAENDLWVSRLESRRFVVDAAGHLAFPLDPESLVVGTSVFESHAARSGGRLGVCTDGAPSGAVYFGTTDGAADTLSFQPVLALPAYCGALAVTGDRWLLSTQVSQSSDMTTRPWTTLLDGAGRVVEPPYQIPDAAPDARLGLVGLNGGFAGGYVNEGGQLVAGWSPGAGPGRGLVIPATAARADVAPAVAAWPADGRQFAILPAVAGVPSRLTVVDSVASTVTATVPVEGYSMDGTTTPALVPTSAGLVVAVAGWGDLDPDNGQLALTLVTPDRVPLAVHDLVSINRVPLARIRGANDRLAGATDGRSVVILWAGRQAQRSGERATFAAVYRCE